MRPHFSRLLLLVAAMAVATMQYQPGVLGAYPASNWIADLNTSPASANPSGFRTLPPRGGGPGSASLMMIFNSNYLGDSGVGSVAGAQQRLVVWNGTATFPLTLAHPREEPTTYYVESDTLGSWFYFISPIDHQIYRTQGRNPDDWEQVLITTPANKRMLFVHQGRLVFEGFDPLLTIPHLGVYVFDPDSATPSTAAQLISFPGTTGLSPYRIETWSSCNNSLLFSAKTTTGQFIHAISPGSWAPFEPLADSLYEMPRPFSQAVTVQDACCATTGHYMYCYNTAISGSRLKFYGLVPSAIALNGSALLGHAVDVDSANTLVTFVGILDNWPAGNGLDHIHGTKIEPPADRKSVV